METPLSAPEPELYFCVGHCGRMRPLSDFDPMPHPRATWAKEGYSGRCRDCSQLDYSKGCVYGIYLDGEPLPVYVGSTTLHPLSRHEWAWQDVLRAGPDGKCCKLTAWLREKTREANIHVMPLMSDIKKEQLKYYEQAYMYELAPPDAATPPLNTKLAKVEGMCEYHAKCWPNRPAPIIRLFVNRKPTLSNAEAARLKKDDPEELKATYAWHRKVRLQKKKEQQLAELQDYAASIDLAYLQALSS